MRRQPTGNKTGKQQRTGRFSGESSLLASDCRLIEMLFWTDALKRAPILTQQGRNHGNQHEVPGSVTESTVTAQSQRSHITRSLIAPGSVI